MEYGYGMQTWEYSPEFSIRSWAYIRIHSWTLAIILFPIRYLFNFDKVINSYIRSFTSSVGSMAVIDLLTDDTGFYV